jgi:tRNA(Ile)-lysidine synthase
MASSRRSAKNAEPAAGSADADPVVGAIARAATAACAGTGHRRWLIAYSGGLDSTVLLHAAVQALGAPALVAAHVHHGLQPAADIWPAHCEAQANALGVAFECLRLKGRPPRGASLEEWARDERYRALADVARRVGACGVLTAHHADDQVETVLMRLARGTGIDGLVGIEPTTVLSGVAVNRPLLALTRAQLVRYAHRNHLRWVQDPSNADLRRARNAIRHRVLRSIDAVLPRFRERLLEALPHVRAARDAQALLAQQDLQRAGTGAGLDRRVLAALTRERCHAALREWLRGQGLRAPTEARLTEMARQLVDARGAHGRVMHEGRALVRDRDTIRVLDPAALAGPRMSPTRLQWRGEPVIELPLWGGRLMFDPVAEPSAAGVDAGWLRARPLTLTAGGASRARLRPGPRAHRRTLKNLYQEQGVPAWMRASLPLVYVEGCLLYAGGIGMDCGDAWPAGGDRVSIRWEAASPGEAGG